jgi:hypothetical protein
MYGARCACSWCGGSGDVPGVQGQVADQHALALGVVAAATVAATIAAPAIPAAIAAPAGAVPVARAAPLARHGEQLVRRWDVASCWALKKTHAGQESESCADRVQLAPPPFRRAFTALQ